MCGTYLHHSGLWDFTFPIKPDFSARGVAALSLVAYQKMVAIDQKPECAIKVRYIQKYEIW